MQAIVALHENVGYPTKATNDIALSGYCGAPTKKLDIKQPEASETIHNPKYVYWIELELSSAPCSRSGEGEKVSLVTHRSSHLRDRVSPQNAHRKKVNENTAADNFFFCPVDLSSSSLI